MASFFIDDGAATRRPVRLSGAIAQGAAGTIHHVIGEPGIVAKLYKDSNDLVGYREKIAAMLAAPPQLPAFHHNGKNYVQIAWPTATVVDGTEFRGFVMPEVDFQESTELENVLQKSVRQRKQLPEFYGTRVLLAANLSALMTELHALGHYMVDMKPMNMRFYPQAWYMAILDTDGFSINGRRRLPARHFSDEYIAPDARGKKPEQLGLEQDLFALAVIIFRLLNNGIHPYQGIDIGNYPTTLQERIFAGLYAYGVRGHPGVRPARSSVHGYLEDNTRALLDCAFQTNGSRPTAAEWRDHINGLIKNNVLVRCAADPKNHGHFSKRCGFCALEQRLAGARAAALRTMRSGRVPNIFQTATGGRPATGGPASAWMFIIPFIAVAVMIRGIFIELSQKQNTPAPSTPVSTSTAQGTQQQSVNAVPTSRSTIQRTQQQSVEPGPVSASTTQRTQQQSVEPLAILQWTRPFAQPVPRSPLLASTLSQNEIDGLRAQLRRCWTPPIDVVGSKDLTVVVRFALNPNGSVLGQPVAVNRSDNPLFQNAVESAIRAVRRCQPLHLPPSKYEAWRDIEVTFDPNDITAPNWPPTDKAAVSTSAINPRPSDTYVNGGQKAVLYEEDQANPNGRQFVGSAVWRTERVAIDLGQKSDVVVQAEIEIPEQKVSARWSLRRNDDKQLSASHTVEIVFTLPTDFPHGGISNIPGMLMKQSEATRGAPLNGVAVRVATNFFLIGLSSVDADIKRNVQLLKERSWFDIPVVYADGKRAIIAIEKGTLGERAFADAFTAWEQ